MSCRPSQLALRRRADPVAASVRCRPDRRWYAGLRVNRLKTSYHIGHAGGRPLDGGCLPYLAAAGGITAGLRGCAARRFSNSAGILACTAPSSAAPTDAVGSPAPGMRIADTGRATVATAVLSADGDAALPIDVSVGLGTTCLGDTSRVTTCSRINSSLSGYHMPPGGALLALAAKAALNPNRCCSRCRSVAIAAWRSDAVIPRNAG